MLCHIRKSPAFVLLFKTAFALQAVAQDSARTTVGGFVDAYFAYSLQSHPYQMRSYTTQPLRHDEFNLNLGFVEVKHQSDFVRGRFALQTGTYVESNLAAEPDLLKLILEASVGTRIGQNVWIDLGIFPSHIGFEGIVSKDNWTYSRSLVADYSPYYEAGLSATWTISGKVSLRGLVLNGWQNINETNKDKALGTQLQYKPSEDVLLNWSSFVGNEQPDSAASQPRIFNDLYAVWTLSPTWNLAIVLDFGFQKEASGSSYDPWHGSSVMVKHLLDDQWAIAGRVEYFSDEHGILIPTGTPDNFQTISTSLNIDYAPAANVVWRIEGRLFDSRDPIYPSITGVEKTDGFIAVSAALSI